MNMDKKKRDEIARVAYSLYEKRGYAPGNNFEDWLEAEKIVQQKYSKGMAGMMNAIKSIQPARAKEKIKSILTRTIF